MVVSISGSSRGSSPFSLWTSLLVLRRDRAVEAWEAAREAWGDEGFEN